LPLPALVRLEPQFLRGDEASVHRRVGVPALALENLQFRRGRCRATISSPRALAISLRGSRTGTSALVPAEAN
jgi:hypothetical protein